MRMKNPFSDEPGDDDKDAAAAPAEESRAEETRESDGPEATEARADDEPSAAPEEPEAEDASGSGGGNGSSSGGGGEASMTAAPSIGPNTVIERKPPEERLDHDKISDTDAMGLDKRRQVVGGSYSPSFARQASLYGIFIAVIAVLAIGFIVLANELDQPPETYADEAPWAQTNAPQRPAQPLE